jgi:hypothetical protein
VGFEQRMTCLTTRRQTTRRRADQTKTPRRRPAHGLKNGGWRNPSWQAHGRELRNLVGPWPSEFYGADSEGAARVPDDREGASRARPSARQSEASASRTPSRSSTHAGIKRAGEDKLQTTALAPKRDRAKTGHKEEAAAHMTVGHGQSSASRRHGKDREERARWSTAGEGEAGCGTRELRRSARRRE